MKEQIEVFKAISAVQKKMSQLGIDKNHTNEKQKYNFRGIDDVYNVLSSMLHENNLLIIPNTLSRVEKEKKLTSSTATFVCLEIEFVFISTIDGSSYKTKIYGEAMDSGDKATNKALSAAYKYCCISCFCIPVVGKDDPDFGAQEISEENFFEASKKDINSANTFEELKKVFSVRYRQCTSEEEKMEIQSYYAEAKKKYEEGIPNHPTT